jgi:hypothetical protein
MVNTKMSEQTLTKLKQVINESDKLSRNLKANLCDEINGLIIELREIEKDNPELAKSLAKNTLSDVLYKVNHPDSNETPDEFIEDIALQYETSHPRITSALQNIVNILSGIGI